jgi:hypothetical protein
MTPDLTCPNCGSKAVRSRRAVYESGSSNYKGRQSTSGMSFGFGKNFRPRFYFGGGSHSGTRQSLFAQKVAPVPMWLGLPIFVIIFLISASFTAGIIFAVLWAGFAFYINEQSFEKEWVCNKCSAVFKPDEALLIGVSKKYKQIGQKVDRIYEEVNNSTDNSFRTKKLKELEKIFIELNNISDDEVAGYSEGDRKNIKILKDRIRFLQAFVKKSEIAELVPLIISGESKLKRKNAAIMVEKLLSEIKALGQKSIIENFNDLKERTSIIIKVTDALDLLDKADKAHFMGEKNKEINYLLESLYSMRKNKVTVKQFDSLAAISETTGDTWTINLIKKNLLRAGYIPPKK